MISEMSRGVWLAISYALQFRRRPQSDRKMALNAYARRQFAVPRVKNPAPISAKS